MRKSMSIMALVCLFGMSQSHAQVVLHTSVNQLPCAVGSSDLLPIQLQASVFPNPSEGIFLISVSGSQQFITPKIRVSNVLGKTVCLSDEKLKTELYKKEIDLSLFPSGVYFIELISEGSSWIKTMRVIVNN